jgi:hypothetical protein
MSWQLLLCSALLVFGLRGSLQLTVWSLAVKQSLIFVVLLLLGLASGQAFSASFMLAFLGIVFVQYGYFVGIIIQMLR